MPTIKQRVTITLTGELEQIIAVEQRLRPDLSPSELVGMLVRRGHLVGDPQRELVASLAGGVRYPEGYLDALRNEWPT